MRSPENDHGLLQSLQPTECNTICFLSGQHSDDRKDTTVPLEHSEAHSVSSISLDSLFWKDMFCRLGNFRQLENLRAEGAKEMWIWFKTSPEVYLVSDAYVKCLQQLLTDFVSHYIVAFVSAKLGDDDDE